MLVLGTFLASPPLLESLRGRLRKNLVTAALAAALVVSSIYAAGSVSSVNSSVPTIHLANPFNAQREQAYGILSIDILLGIKQTSYGANSLPTYYKPIGGETVSISLSSSPEATPLILVTNANGLVRAELPVSNDYVGSITDTRFHIAIPFSILADTTTFIVVRAMRQSSPVLYDEIYATRSGSNTTTQTIFLKLGPTADFSNSSLSVFLERSALPVKDFVDPNTNSSVAQTPVRILAQHRDAGGLWVEILVDQSGELGVASQLSLVTYMPVYSKEFGSR